MLILNLRSTLAEKGGYVQHGCSHAPVTNSNMAAHKTLARAKQFHTLMNGKVMHIEKDRDRVRERVSCRERGGGGRGELPL